MKDKYEEVINNLTEEQFYVTQKNGTELPFTNIYDDHFETGIYVDIVSKKVLFSSLDKFNSGCGWPAFSKPVDKSVVVEKLDKTHGMTRVEVRSNDADSHLGHVFNDGPEELTGYRYCINSSALEFISIDEMEARGYAEYLSLFK